MKLRDYLNIKEIPVGDFARKVGCTRKTIYNIMDGVTNPSGRILVAIERETNRKVRMEDFDQIYD